MANTLVFVEQRNGQIKKSCFELIGAAAASGQTVTAVVLGDQVKDPTAELGAAGAARVLLVEHASLKIYNSEAYSKAFAEIVKKESPVFVMGTHSPLGKDLFPHVAALLSVGTASDCTSVKFQGDGVTLKRPLYAGKAIAEVEFVGPGPKLFTVRQNALGPQKATAATAKLEKVSPTLSDLKSKPLEIVKGTSARPDVTEASIVVSGGRSLKSADGFKILETMADLLGAAVGASRAAVDAGFRPHRDQVGQTGKVVSPALYIACGISGAIQHLAGMRTSKVIVAINTDKEAPIFQLADYAVVCDLFTLVPLLTEEFKKLKEGS